MDFHLDQFFDASIDLLSVSDEKGKFIKVNPAFHMLLGYTEEDLLGKSVLYFVHPDDLATTRKEIARLGEGIPTIGYENRFRTADGDYLWLRWSLFPNEENSLLYAIGRDITHLRNAGLQMEMVMESSPNAMITVNRNEKILSANDEAVHLFGYRKEELIGANFHILVPPSVRPDHPVMHRKFMDNAEKRRMGLGERLKGRRKDGTEFPIEVGLTPLKGPEGFIVICGIVDLSAIEKKEEKILAQQKELEEKNRELEILASYDVLTGLKNRRILFEEMEAVMGLMDRQTFPVSLIMADVDHFKKLNDTFGHQAGDAVLKTIGGIFSDSARESDVVARYGGEEFCVFLPGADESGVRMFAEKLRDKIEKQPWDNRAVTASFGVYTMHPHGEEGIKTAELLIKRADTALYKAKEGGRNRVVAFSPGMEKP